MSADLNLDAIGGVAACGFPIPAPIATALIDRVKTAEQERDEAEELQVMFERRATEQYHECRKTGVRLRTAEARLAKVQEAVDEAGAHRFDFDPVPGPVLSTAGGPDSFYNGVRFVMDRIREALGGEA